ncbi:MAG: tRNA (adenosine(37)-N6)-threonylcarbamoyltransferase complex dimerization subunit type 1 TsaB [Selenomonas sp.]|uniref:tRNA (adenosine(37)-N6)-threonylcarbamoyltransferase complex dimerization subunit type 1 TsaB n=1 Tax=Selenomonas sp. TaxID=2053611 RepID=UPI0025E631FD|nr:tRNA (adenosine(37)-N6)-threonylcarbamoyltransferase complex dimerization subunit type 1 TsaB [Selenomonas sp.]MCI6085803.1 tRNA (adenosine(37)-N6)-threonylcarbamoyltransferase complex dimerization subunit type 1 TsaB [Selenomonas sp.]
MQILSLDTSTQVSSVAVLADGRLASEITMQARLTHSETLLPHIEQALQMAGVKKETLTGLAVSIGPGSFTGLRIGLAAAKAMSYALGIPIVGVPSLEALALHYRVPGVTIYAMTDAQKRNIYVETIEWQPDVDGLKMAVKQPVAVRPLSDVLAEAGADAENGETVVLVGDIVQKKLIGSDGRAGGKIDVPAGVLLPPPELVLPRASHVAWLGAERLARGEADNVMDLEPIYLRKSEAEELWTKHHAEDEHTVVDSEKTLNADEAHGRREVSR